MDTMQGKQCQAGLTLVEMMLGQLLGVLVVGGLLGLVPPAIALFHGNSGASVLQENLRLASDTLDQLIQQAGYAGCHRGDNHANVIQVDAPEVSARLQDWAFGRFALRGLDADEADRARALLGAGWHDGRHRFDRLPVGDILWVQSTSGAEWRLSSHRPENESMIIESGSPVLQAGTVLRVADCEHSATFQVASTSTAGASPLAQRTRITYGAGHSINCPASYSHQGIPIATGRVLLGAATDAHCRADAAGPDFLPYRFPSGSQVMPLQSTLLYLGRHRESGEPGLYRLDIAGNSTRSYSEAIIEGVENLRFRYGIDADGDGVPDQWHDASAIDGLPQSWQRVVAVRVWLMLRTPKRRGRGIYRHSLRFPDQTGQMVDCRNAAPDAVSCPFTPDPSTGSVFLRRVFEKTLYLRNQPGGRTT